jgi:hypothetical protein
MKMTYPIFLMLIASVLAIPLALGATSQQQTVSGTLGNNAPVIIQVNTDSASYNPVESGTRTVTVTMQIYDADGYQNIDNSSLYVNATKAGIVYGSNKNNIACGSPIVIDANTTQCTATVTMNYYDEAGTWTVTGYGADYSGASDTNSTTYTYNSLKAWTINKNTIGFGSFALTTPANFPDNVQMNNTGNSNQTEINVTAYDLVGQTNPAYTLPVNANTFRSSEATTWATATGLVNATATTTANTYLDVKTSATGEYETVYFGIDPTQFNPSTIAQIYQNPAGQEWTIST